MNRYWSRSGTITEEGRVKYLNAAAVEASGQHFDIPLTEKQPCIPLGQRLVAVLTCGRTSIAIDVSDPEVYSRTFCTHENMFIVRLFWLDEDKAPLCRLADGTN